MRTPKTRPASSASPAILKTASADNLGRDDRNAHWSWFGRNRRLAKDYENLADTLAAFITLACIQLAIRRLARP
jgi:hypothetical protein